MPDTMSSADALRLAAERIRPGERLCRALCQPEFDYPTRLTLQRILQECGDAEILENLDKQMPPEQAHLARQLHLLLVAEALDDQE